MRLVTGSPGTRKRDGGDHSPVVWRAFVEVHDGQEVGINASLISGPDEQDLFPIFISLFFLFFLLSSIALLGGSRFAPPDSHQAQTKQRCDKEERCKFQKLAAAGNCLDHDLCFLSVRFFGSSFSGAGQTISG